MDSIKYAILGTGSTANSYIFEHNGESYVVDNGFSLKEFEKRAGEFNFDPNRIKMIFVTHLHTDHIKGVELLAAKYNIPVGFHNEINPNEIFTKKPVKTVPLTHGEKYQFGCLEIIPFETSHDSIGATGYTLHLNGHTFTIITDTGEILDEMYKYAFHSRILFLESNYSDEMLEFGNYPWHLKQRIRSKLGHLSNHDAARFMKHLSEMDKISVKKIYLCHLSKNNNTPAVAEEEISSIYKGLIPYRICQRDVPVMGETI